RPRDGLSGSLLRRSQGRYSVNQDDSNDLNIRLRVLNPQGAPLGGTVDIELRAERLGNLLTVKAANASRDIDIRLCAPGLYQLTVTPTDVFKPVSRFVSVPPSGCVVIEVTIDKGAQPPVVKSGYKVYGFVRDASQLPLAGASVKAFDRDIR